MNADIDLSFFLFILFIVFISKQSFRREEHQLISAKQIKIVMQDKSHCSIMINPFIHPCWTELQGALEPEFLAA